MGKSVYHFDRWAEFLTVTLAENIARCSISQSPIQKVRVQLASGRYWPVGFKAILENGLVAKQAQQKTLEQDNTVNALEYYYRCPSQLPQSSAETDTIAKEFIPMAHQWDEAFYADAWSLKMADCIPTLLMKLGYRSVGKMLSHQLKHQGLDVSEDFEVQFYDGKNFHSFFYDSIVDELKRQIGFYLGDARVFKEAMERCFKHDDNKRWFTALKD